MNIDELEKEVRRLSDIEEIKQLKARYGAMCNNNHDYTQVDSIFAPEAEWAAGDETAFSNGGGHIGRKKIAEHLKWHQTQLDGIPGKGVLGHNFMNPRIVVDDDGVHASGQWTMIGFYRTFVGRKTTGSKSFIEQGEYDEQYVKIDEEGSLDSDGRWYIQRLMFNETLWASPQDGWDDEVIQS